MTLQQLVYIINRMDRDLINGLVCSHASAKIREDKFAPQWLVHKTLRLYIAWGQNSINMMTLEECPREQVNIEKSYVKGRKLYQDRPLIHRFPPASPHPTLTNSFPHFFGVITASTHVKACRTGWYIYNVQIITFMSVRSDECPSTGKIDDGIAFSLWKKQTKIQQGLLFERKRPNKANYI